MYPSCYFISNFKSLPLRGKVAAGRMRAKSAIAARKRVVPARPPLISQRAGPLTASPKGEATDCRKRCAHPLAPSARGLRPQAVGERTVRLPEIFRAMARFSPSAPSGHLPRRGRFFDTLRGRESVLFFASLRLPPRGCARRRVSKRNRRRRLLARRLKLPPAGG